MKQRKIDIDKVIREIEERSKTDNMPEFMSYESGYTNGLQRAIQIIKDNIKEVDIKESDCIERYFDLLGAVESKYPNETRYQTAKRYIREKEVGKDCSSCK